MSQTSSPKSAPCAKADIALCQSLLINQIYEILNLIDFTNEILTPTHSYDGLLLP